MSSSIDRFSGVMVDWGMAFYVFLVGIAGVGLTLVTLDVCTRFMSFVVRRFLPEKDAPRGDET